MIIEALKAWLESTIGADALALLKHVYWGVIAPILGERRLIPPLILSTIAAATVYYYWQRGRGKVHGGLLKFLVPSSVFLHPSAKLDYKFFVVNQVLMAHVAFGGVVLFVIGLLSISAFTAGALTNLFGARPADGIAPSMAVLLAYTIINLLAWDFGKWYAHYLTHKVPILWEFHKVHHAEEVLTPISAFRAHPIDIMVDFFFRLLFTSFVGGIFSYFYPSGIVELKILGFNAAGLLIHYWVSHLQHSHIPLSYGRFNKILFSPVMHQVHHSCEVHHWDKNFGFIFGIWDHLFGTLHNPREGEAVKLGLPEGKGAGQYTTLAELYFRPFVGTWRLLTTRRRTTMPAG